MVKGLGRVVRGLVGAEETGISITGPGLPVASRRPATASPTRGRTGPAAPVGARREDAGEGAAHASVRHRRGRRRLLGLLPRRKGPPRRANTLDEVRPGQRAVIAGFTRMDPTVHRLMQLGMLVDGDVEVIRRAPAGDPIEIRILGYALSLRRAEARCVQVRDVR